MPATGLPKYESLRRYLAGLPPEVAEVTLTLAEIAAIVGAPAREAGVSVGTAYRWLGAPYRVAS
jgi:hypothetical protein